MTGTVGNYTRSIVNSYGELMTVKEYLINIAMGAFTDYDGYGYAVKDCHIDESKSIFPSSGIDNIPNDATHIIW
ncbi:MAG: hypothetical protein KDC82_04685, partial [Bacteroidetes bacterium]|nr:hypothetical protein [Bacteroidota bacterium]